MEAIIENEQTKGRSQNGVSQADFPPKNEHAQNALIEEEKKDGHIDVAPNYFFRSPR